MHLSMVVESEPAEPQEPPEPAYFARSRARTRSRLTFDLETSVESRYSLRL